ncbi:Transposon Tn10 TetD protein [Rubripirellula amarantea]|uniref:Transposon Tn10 TetD protein n=1 Tax=Rubripirellula amarantea TaxID=2527999 RepID=A0A5C5WI11_9BACT|nr:AraC family transcriptional regulator [Rubripirellula amarantea]TWT50436.1 Transposon Tn10 TetD protein [Rubripirellula amarantea]
MKPAFEKLVPRSGESFRCFDRSELSSPAKWHRHPEIELTYVPRGSGSRIVGDHIDSYTDRDLVLLGSELPHTWTSDEYLGQTYDRHHAIVTQFHPEFLGFEFFACGEMTQVAGLLQRSQRGIWFPPKVAASVGQKLDKLIASEGAARLLLLISILDELSRCADAVALATAAFRVSSGAATGSARETRIQKVCDHIGDRLDDPELTLKSLAELAGMNSSAFTRFFKQSTGRTPSAYIGELRIGLACRLLTDTDDTILSICHQSGFSNLSNFNRRFQQMRSMTPREYRSNFRVVT